MTQGAKRGLFSNEAGMGSTPHAHAMANVKDPHEQGTVAMMGVFVDTIVVVTMTALVVISVLYCGDGQLANAYAQVAAGTNADPAAIAASVGLDKTNMAQTAFGAFFGGTFGNIFVAVCLLLFAFSTILSWNLYAKINVQYLFHNSKVAVRVFQIVALVFIFLVLHRRERPGVGAHGLLQQHHGSAECHRFDRSRWRSKHVRQDPRREMRNSPRKKTPRQNSQRKP